MPQLHFHQKTMTTRADDNNVGKDDVATHIQVRHPG